MIRAGKSLTSTGEKAAMVDLGEAINAMLKAFRVRGDAVALMNLYMGELADLDVDETIRALGRFSRQVVPGHNNAFEPNPVQVRAEVRRMAEMFASPDRPERVALPAPKVEPRTEEDRAKADAILRAAGFGPKDAGGKRKPGEETEAERKRRAEQMRKDADARAANRARIAQEWADRGEEPVYADEARTMMISPALATLLGIQNLAAGLGFDA